MSALNPKGNDRGTVRVAAVAHQAEKALGQLSPQHLEQIVQELANGVPLARCKSITRLKRYRVRRYDASETLRVTLRPLPVGMTVLHAGTHAEGDKFIRLYDGHIPEHLVPIQESVLMKSPNKPQPHAVPLHAPKAVAPSPPAPPVAAAPPAPVAPAPVAPAPVAPAPSPGAAEAEVLGALKLLTGRWTDDKLRSIEGDIDSLDDRIKAGERAQADANARLHELAAGQAKQEQAIRQNADAARTDTAALRVHVTRTIEGQTGALSALADELRQAVRQNADLVRAAADELRDRWAAELSAVKDGQRQALQQAADARDEVTKLRDQSAAAHAEQAARAARGYEELLARVDALGASGEQRDRAHAQVAAQLRVGLDAVGRHLGEHAAVAQQQGEWLDRVDQQAQQAAARAVQVSALLGETQASVAHRLARIEAAQAQLDARLSDLRAAVERLSRAPDAPAPRSVLGKWLARLGL